MSSQGPLSGGTFTDDATVGTITWTNPGNAAASDDSYATAATGFASGDVSHYLRATNFGFTIPAGATIDGVVVGVERKANVASHITDSSVRLYTGSFVGDNKATATNWPTTDTYEDHGGAADGWNASLTQAIVNASTFGVGVAGTHIANGLDTMSIDHIRITVHYTAAAGGGSQVIVVGI